MNLYVTTSQVYTHTCKRNERLQPQESVYEKSWFSSILHLRKIQPQRRRRVRPLWGEYGTLRSIFATSCEPIIISKYKDLRSVEERISVTN